MTRCFNTVSLVLLMISAPVCADYAVETGFSRLQAELGAGMPTGAGIGVSQVEGGPQDGTGTYFLPQTGIGTFAGSGGFSGVTFTVKSSAPQPRAYFHALEIGQLCYGNNTAPEAGLASMAPGVTAVDCWYAGVWDDDFLSPGGAAPVTETRRVQMHTWVSDSPSAAADPTYNGLLRRQDYSIHQDKYVCVAGLNNGAGTPVPDLMTSGYNTISAGLSNGLHSRNGTTSGMDGVGRRKPEIVVPVGATSYATAYVGSAACLLLDRAVGISTAAADPRTIKAALMAGATKEEFAGWAKSSAHPIDAVYGAGELNIYNSYRILNGGEQVPGSTSVPVEAWDFAVLTVGTSLDYRLPVPAGRYVVEFSACVVWHRQPVDGSSAGFNLNNPTLANYNLALLRDPAVGGAAVAIDASNSTIYNFEHVWSKNLPAGNYRLQLSRHAQDAATGTHQCAVAWRMVTAPHEPVPVISRSGGSLTFNFNGLLTGQPYKFQSATSLNQWTDVSTFTGGSAVPAVILPEAARGQFRLLPVLP